MAPHEPSAAKSWLNWKTGAVVLGMAALLAASHFLPLAAWFGRLNGWVASLGWAGPLAFVGVYAVGTVLFMPGSVMTIAAGVLFGWWAIPVVSVGATLGASLAFLVARYLAREQIARFAEKNLRFQAIDQAVGAQGAKLIGLLRLSPIVPFNVSNYFYGLTQVKFWPYVLASFLGMLPGACLYVYLGTVGKVGLDGGHHGHRSLEYVFLGVGLAATVFVTIFVARLARRALEEAEISASESR